MQLDSYLFDNANSKQKADEKQKYKFPDDFIDKVICGDCLEVMKYIPNNSVDLVITDPPYGNNMCYGRKQKRIIGDESPLLSCYAILELERILKEDGVIYVFTNYRHYPFLYQFIQTYTDLKFWDGLLFSQPI